MRLTIGWLFPKLMNIYGDRGNIISLQRRAQLRGIETDLVEITEETSSETIRGIDLFVGGGAQDKEQEIVLDHCKKRVGVEICNKLEEGTPALLVCGAFQIFRKSYKGLEGLGFFNCHTESSEESPLRLVGDLIFKINNELPLVIGFENHRLRTYLEKGEAFGEVIKGYGNNGKDHTEGVFYKNAIGTYAHGPLLPKNPFLTDWLLKKALTIDLIPLDDHLAEASRQVLLTRYSIDDTDCTRHTTGNSVGRHPACNLDRDNN